MINIYDEVKEYNSIAISGHEKPDGDCIGSCLAMYLYLKKRMPNACIDVLLQEPSSSFSNIPAIEVIDSSFSEEREYDVFIVIDTVPERTGLVNLYKKAKKTINIDHHISNSEGQGMVNYIVPDASSASELVYNLIDKEYFDKDIAALVYMGIAHDTGVFKYSGTTSDTLKIAAELISYGFDFSTMLDETFFEKSYVQNRFHGKILQESELLFDGKVIIGLADKSIMEQFGATKNDFEGCVEALRITKGVQVAALIYPKSEGISKISLRSKSDEYNIAGIAEYFGGGGHVRAAGTDSKADVYETKRLLIEQLKKIMN